MKALLFDCETTGLLSNRKLKLEQQPYLVEFYCCLFDFKKGKVIDEFDTFIRPPKPDVVTPEITRITGISYKEHLEDAPCMKEVSQEIFKRLEKAPVVIAHNLSFDMEMIEIEAERLGQKVKWPKQKICTVEQTVHIKGYRFSLSALHQYLFDEVFAGAHRAKVDVQALLRCCRELYKREMI